MFNVRRESESAAAVQVLYCMALSAAAALRAVGWVKE
jgi:hypothetical protein